MIYRVVITPAAETDLRTASHYLYQHSPRAARQWLMRVRQSIRTLAHHPDRCPLAPESDSFEEPIRQLFFGTGSRGTYRILFVVDKRTVYILHVRHGSMLPLPAADE